MHTAQPQNLSFPEEEFRKAQPAPTAQRPFKLPPVKPFTLKNGIKVFLVEQYTLPIVSMDLNFDGGSVTDAKGKQTEWGFECGSPNMMVRTGWTRTTLKTGDKVTVVGNPLHDGRPNAILVRITLPDGRVLGPGDAPPPRKIS